MILLKSQLLSVWNPSRIVKLQRYCISKALQCLGSPTHKL